MNPDPNQPAQPEQPTDPSQTPVPEASQTPAEPTPFGPSASEQPAPASAEPAANPFGGTPVSSDAPASNPFGAAPAATPVTPAGPTTIGSSPNSDPAPDFNAKSKKKKLIILISVIVGALVILGGAAIAVYLMFFNVTHADYQKAYDQVSAVRDKYSADDSISSGSSKDTIDAAKTAYADFKTESAKLGDLKALKVDKDLNAKYKAYQAKEKDYIAFGDVFIPSLDSFITATDKISALGTGADSFSSANIQKTIDIYKGVQNISDPTLKAFVDSAVSIYEEILPQAKIYEASSSTSSQKLAAISAISDSSDKLSDAANKMSDDLETKTKAVSLEDVLNDLGQAVTNKTNGKK